MYALAKMKKIPWQENDKWLIRESWLNCDHDLEEKKTIKAVKDSNMDFNIELKKILQQAESDFWTARN